MDVEIVPNPKAPSHPRQPRRRPMPVAMTLFVIGTADTLRAMSVSSAGALSRR